MQSSRQQKFARLIQKELAEVFQRQIPHLLPAGAMVSVREVRPSPDLSMARVFLGFLLAPDPAGLLATISENKAVIRRQLAQRVGKQLRIVPDLQFFHDDSASYAAHIDQLLTGLVTPPLPPVADDPA